MAPPRRPTPRQVEKYVWHRLHELRDLKQAAKQELSYRERLAIALGGPGSGNFGHGGRPGEVGGSSGGGSGGAVSAKMKSGDIKGSERLGGGINTSLIVTLEFSSKENDYQGTKAVYKPETGEVWEGSFANKDIGKLITNRAFSLAEREATAYEISEALGIGFVPETVLREQVEVEIPHEVARKDDAMPIRDSSGNVVGGGPGQDYGTKNTEAPHPNGGSLQHFREGAMTAQSSFISKDDSSKLAVLDYVLGTMDRHSTNLMFEDGHPVMIDNGYSLPASNTPDGFMFRSDHVDRWLRSDNRRVPAEVREPIRAAIKNTDWKAFADQHPDMNTKEREALMGRLANMDEALATDEGLAMLWSTQQLY